MNKTNENNDLVRNVKATFFDVFAEQIKELVDALQKFNSSVDPVEKKTYGDKVNQLVGLLSNTMDNVQNLNTNISNFEQAVDNNLVAEEKSIEASANDQVPINSTLTEEENSQVPAAIIAPSSSNITAQTFEMTENQSVQVEATDTMPEPVQAPVQAPVSVSQPPVQTPDPAQSSVPVSNPFELPPIKTDLGNSVPQPPATDVNLPPVVSTTDSTTAVSMSIKKTNNDRGKAILVNVSQLTKLINSKNIQRSKLDFGAMNGANSNQAQIEELMRQAGELYKAGRTAEAQALYAQISALNGSNN